jgi:Holliday junction DNA helicase RuvA
MIGRLKGILLEKLPPQLLVDVQGVGYELEAPMSTFYQLPVAGQEVLLHTHLVVREDAQLLYAFYSISERQLFRDLIRISGVGPKLALTILSGVSADEFTRCVMDNDAKALTRLPGVGKKTAERLIIELRDRLAKEVEAALTGAGGSPAGSSVASRRIEISPVNEAVSALMSLGYRAQEASQMVRAIETEGLKTEEIIKTALQSLVRG